MIDKQGRGNGESSIEKNKARPLENKIGGKIKNQQDETRQKVRDILSR